jgi:hypothetical protein
LGPFQTTDQQDAAVQQITGTNNASDGWNDYINDYGTVGSNGSVSFPDPANPSQTMTIDAASADALSSGTGVAAPLNAFSNPGIDFNQGANGIGGGQVNPVRDTGAASITSMPDTSGYPSGVPGGLGSDFFNGGGDVGTQLPPATNGSAPTSLGIIGGGDVSSGSPLGIFGTLGGNTGGLGGQIGNGLGGGAGGGGGGPGGTLGGLLVFRLSISDQ